MLTYQIYQSQLKDSPSFGKYYARIVSQGTFHIPELAAHMASHNTPLSKGFLEAVLKDAVSCINELALDGKRIILDNLVSFGLSVKHKSGAATADEFSIAKNVESVVLQAIGVGEFSKSMLTQAAKLKESNSYISPRSSSTDSGSEAEGESPVTPPDTGGDDGDGDMGA
ncbi:MAG: DNA-binding protein [Prevotella sp.]